MSEGKGCQRDRNARKIDISEGEGVSEIEMSETSLERLKDGLWVESLTREVNIWTMGKEASQ